MVEVPSYEETLIENAGSLGIDDDFLAAFKEKFPPHETDTPALDNEQRDLQEAAGVLRNILSWIQIDPRVTEGGRHADHSLLSRLKSRFPELKSVNVAVDENHPRGATEFAIYYHQQGTDLTILLIDHQQGNYAGGTSWHEGDSAPKLLEIMQNISDKLRLA